MFSFCTTITTSITTNGSPSYSGTDHGSAVTYYCNNGATCSNLLNAERTVNRTNENHKHTDRVSNGATGNNLLNAERTVTR
ncbi:hypothetical protein DPMN_057634, partial [Dreissena polymorpha]